MDRTKLIARVRSITRDFTSSIFREADIINFIDEGIDRFKQVLPELTGLTYLYQKTSEPSLIPSQYQHLLAVYSASRCFGQDERHYQASNLMNEFEIKLNEFKLAVENGEITLTDGDGNAIEITNVVDYVDLEEYWGVGKEGYFTDEDDIFDEDKGVEGVE